MIRPFTVVCMLMAGASGLYLYQSKHQAQVLDREIAKTIKQTDQTRERISMLKAEWALLNEPERLAELARAHLGLRPLAPTQFVAINDIATRLPAPVTPGSNPAPAEPEPEETPVAAPMVAQAAPPAPKAAIPRPTATQAVASTEPKPAETKTAEAKPTEPKPARHARPAPVQVAAVSAAPVARPIMAPVVTASVNDAATAPGTVGAAVLRAMRANSAAYAPQPVYAHPAYAQPAYAQPAYAAPAAPSYAPQASLLGGSRGALPPPVPYAAR